MCNTPLLDLDTFYQVKKAAPLVTDTPPNEARMILTAMQSRFEYEPEIGMDNRPYWHVYLGDMSLPEALTPNRIGKLCRAMGLTLIRRKTGYMVVFTYEQWEILMEHFGMGVGKTRTTHITYQQTENVKVYLKKMGEED